MHHNPNNDPRYRQYQLEMCRDQLNRGENRFPERRQRGGRDERRERADRPIFNEFGQAINMPPNLCRAPPPPPNYYPGPGYDPAFNQFSGNYTPPPPWQNEHYRADNESNNTFSLCYSLSDDQNSPARRILDHLKGHPLVPKNMTPKHVIFVYEKPENLVIPQGFIIHASSPPLLPPKPPTNEAAVGDFSVVRYDVETQTEWVETRKGDTDKERSDAPPLSPADNTTTTIPSKPITSDNSKVPVELADCLSEGEEFNSAIVKVAEWLQLQKKDVDTKKVATALQLAQLPIASEVDAATETDTKADVSQKTENVPTTIVRHTHEEKKSSGGSDGKTGLSRDEQTDGGNEQAGVDDEEPNTEEKGPESHEDPESVAKAEPNSE